MNIEFDIPEFDTELRPLLQHKLDNKAKPVGSLGKLKRWLCRLD